jgi:hypothetical protein
MSDPQSRPDRADPAEVGREAADSVEDRHGGTIPVEQEQPHPEPARDADDAQPENAETSLDQPSEG